MKIRCRSLGLVCTILGLLIVTVPAQAPLRVQPNILFLFADDLAVDGVAALGGQDVKTPNLDRLAARGTTFTRAYNMGAWNGAVCIASRAMLMTGRSVWHAKKVSGKAALAAEQNAGRLWPGLMAAAGYRTFMTGKWHNEIPPAQCFHVVRGLRMGGMAKDDRVNGYQRPQADGGDPWNPADPSRGGYWEGGRHWTEVTSGYGMNFVREGKASGQPWFAYVAFNAPHDPRQSPQSYLDQYAAGALKVPENFLPEYPFKEAIGQGPALRDEALAPFPRTPHAVQVHRREYYAMITQLDEWIGKILTTLEESGQADRTVIIFTSDHGLALGRHGFMGKQSLYEHSTRVPFLMAGPGVPAAGKIAAPVYLQDAMPTALELAGAPVPPHVDFRSLLPFLQPGSSAQARDVIYATDLILQRSLTWNDWKLLAYPKAKTIRLYHLAADPLEMHDLAAEPAHEAKIREGFQRLLAEQAKIGDSLDLRTSFPEWTRLR